MTDTARPFDEFPYLALPIEWTAPEALALASAFHGGPRLRPLSSRVLELGCADGANLLPMAWYRSDARFVGVDGSSRQIGIAEESRKKLGIKNIRFIRADFESVGERLDGEFDIIIAHGVVSWVNEAVRGILLDLCRQRLAPGGLVYLNYNSRPGWYIRGLVREFLLEHTANAGDLKARAEMCRELSSRLIEPLSGIEHHYTQLMVNEFSIVCRSHPAYIAHEYLAPENNAWWRSEFMEMTSRHGLEYVADADFNSVTNRSTALMQELMSEQGMPQAQVRDSVDLLCYQQMHSPIMTHAGFERKMMDDTELSSMSLASSLSPLGGKSAEKNDFRHPSGYEIEVRDPALSDALIRLKPEWPRGLSVGDLFSDVKTVRPDIEQMTRTDIIRMRCVEPGDYGVDPVPLNRLEAELRGHVTSPYHVFSPVEDGRPGA